MHSSRAALYEGTEDEGSSVRMISSGCDDEGSSEARAYMHMRRMSQHTNMHMQWLVRPVGACAWWEFVGAPTVLTC